MALTLKVTFSGTCALVLRHGPVRTLRVLLPDCRAEWTSAAHGALVRGHHAFIKFDMRHFHKEKSRRQPDLIYEELQRGSGARGGSARRRRVGLCILETEILRLPDVNKRGVQLDPTTPPNGAETPTAKDRRSLYWVARIPKICPTGLDGSLAGPSPMQGGKVPLAASLDLAGGTLATEWVRDDTICEFVPAHPGVAPNPKMSLASEVSLTTTIRKGYVTVLTGKGSVVLKPGSKGHVHLTIGNEAIEDVLMPQLSYWRPHEYDFEPLFWLTTVKKGHVHLPVEYDAATGNRKGRKTDCHLALFEKFPLRSKS